MEPDLSLIPQGAAVAVACSGGRDSMALLEALCAAGVRVRVLHVNHALRPTAGRDEAFVREQAARRGLEVRVYTASAGQFDGENVEQAARAFRRQCFEDAVRSGWADLVATAHHARDNAETVLLHLLRGSGLRGMRGMAKQSGCIIRPLLAVSREEIDAFVAARGVPFVEDETNADTALSRNFLRHEVLPLLETRFVGAVGALNRFAALAAEEDALLDALAPEPVCRGGEVTVAIPPETPEPLARRALAKALRMLLPTDAESAHLDALLTLRSRRSGARISLPHGVCAANGYGTIALFRPAPVRPLRIDWDGQTAPDGWQLAPVSLRSGPSPERPAPVRYVPEPPEDMRLEPDTTDRYVPEPPDLLFDADAVPSGAVWRHRKAGDVFSPFGGGTRPLKEYLIDRKIPARTRDGLALLACGDTVLLIAGVEIARSLAVTRATRRVLRLSRAPAPRP